MIPFNVIGVIISTRHQAKLKNNIITFPIIMNIIKPKIGTISLYSKMKFTQTV